MVRMIHKTQTQGYHSFEPTQKAVSDFVKHADAFFPRTVWGTKCRSWFKGGMYSHEIQPRIDLGPNVIDWFL